MAKDIVERLKDAFPMYPNGTKEKRLLSAAVIEIESLREKLLEIREWYDRDGSVGGLSNIMDPDDD